MLKRTGDRVLAMSRGNKRKVFTSILHPRKYGN